jgi:dihydroxy-acid dehydratase
VGGPIGLVRDGDIIEIDIEKGTIELHITAEELDYRRRTLQLPKPRCTSGVLAKYAKLVTSAAKGARCLP